MKGGSSPEISVVTLSVYHCSQNNFECSIETGIASYKQNR